MVGATMDANVDTVVVGAGPMGASAARHLSADPAAGRVMVIGPDMPANRTASVGPFGAWHDEARLTRIIADDDVWASLAASSIARYEQIATEGGQPFHRTQGVVYVHELEEAFHRQVQVGARHGAVFQEVAPEQLPHLRMKPGTRVIAEHGGAGTVNPRLLVQNQLVAAERRDATVVRDHVVGIDDTAHGVRVHLAGGDVVRAERAIVAAGAYVHAFDLLPQPLPVTSVGITALFFAVDGPATAELADTPGMLWHEDGDGTWLYSVPPTSYPDGRTWFKIGGYRDSGPVRTADEIDQWHRQDGATSEAAFLREWVADHIPVLAGRDAHTVGCVITESTSTRPVIRHVSPRIVVATGCGGAAAKSCDEIGRLAAVLSAQGVWDSPLDQELFAG
jgi:sarcosine oxidase